MTEEEYKVCPDCGSNRFTWKETVDREGVAVHMDDGGEVLAGEKTHVIYNKENPRCAECSVMFNRDELVPEDEYNRENIMKEIPPELTDTSTQNAAVRLAGYIVKSLEVGDHVRVIARGRDKYHVGDITETWQDFGERYFATMETTDDTEIELHANWEDIPPDHEDQETPETGVYNMDNNVAASPPIKNIEVVNNE